MRRNDPSKPKRAEESHTRRTGPLQRNMAFFKGSHQNPKEGHHYPKGATTVCVAIFGRNEVSA